MANFNDHLYYGTLTSIISSGVGYTQFGLTSVQSAACFVIGILASLAPDIDLPKSTPGQLLFSSLGVILPVGLLLYYPDYAKGFRLEHWIVVLAAGYIAVKYLLSDLFDRIVVHRGMFHSIPAILICGEFVFLLFGHTPLYQRTAIAVIAMIGYLTHLIADELNSVDWSGNKLKLKRSAGTAITLGNFTRFSTWFTYIILSALGWLIYIQLLHSGQIKW